MEKKPSPKKQQEQQKEQQTVSNPHRKIKKRGCGCGKKKN